MAKEQRATKLKKRPARRPTKKEHHYRNVGRKSLLTKEMVLKLEFCASIRATTLESCSYCNISHDTYWRWIRDNPELSDRLKELREKPFIIARSTIYNDLKSVGTAFKFLEKEKPEEYGEKLKIEHSESGLDLLNEEDEKLRQEYRQKLKENIENRWKNKNKQNEKPADKKEV